MTPLVSIIIPTYNRAHLIGETLDSVLAQTYTNWECIVVDDGSTDNTSEVLAGYCEKDDRFKYHHRPKDRLPGGNAARNYGFELSKGEYIQWFDSDDIMDPEKLSIQEKSLTNSDFNYSVCDTVVFENTISNIVKKTSEKLISENVIKDFITYKVIILTPNLLIKKIYLNTFKILFDEDLKAAQEWEFNFRILYHCQSYHVYNKPLVYVRKHSQNISSKKESFLIEQYFLARLKIYKNPEIILNDSEKKQIQEFLQRYLKKMIRMQDFKNSFVALLNFVFLEKEYSFKTKVFCLLSVFSFVAFNKGEFFLKNVFYKYEKK